MARFATITLFYYSEDYYTVLLLRSCRRSFSIFSPWRPPNTREPAYALTILPRRVGLVVDMNAYVFVVCGSVIDVWLFHRQCRKNKWNRDKKKTACVEMSHGNEEKKGEQKLSLRSKLRYRICKLRIVFFLSVLKLWLLMKYLTVFKALIYVRVEKDGVK